MNNKHYFLIGILLLLLAACSGMPKFNMTDVITSKTPKQLVANFEQYKNKDILIGGTIVNSTNTKAGTQLEILAYPLDSGHAPQADTQTTGRFIALHKGYLETLEYAPERQVSLIGHLTRKEHGKIGEVEYTYPMLEIKQIHLWDKGHNEDFDGHMQFGIGIMFRR